MRPKHPLSSDTDYNPKSFDAMLAQILQRMDSQDESLARIETGVEKTNGRVTTLEHEKWYQRGFVSAISILTSAVWHWITSK